MAIQERTSLVRLHLPGVPHTITREEFSHCAFTGKVLKFPAMMVPLGYEVIHYGVEGAHTMASEQVDLMSEAEYRKLLGHDLDPTAFVGDDANVENPLYVRFNELLRVELERRVRPGDIVLLPFGHAHTAAVTGHDWTIVESGIGYPILVPGVQFRIYESYAWMHWHQGHENRNGKNYEWVVPNYFDVKEWDFSNKPDASLVVYLGRICDIKGLRTVVEMAKHRPDLRFIICGQGDPRPYLTQSNIEYLPPLSGHDRSDLLGMASVLLTPSEYTEPFCGVAVEAMLCGTPVLSSSYGAFTETIVDGVTGFRCHTLGDFLAGLERVHELNRECISIRARQFYGYEPIGQKYDRVFKYISDLRTTGWYTLRSDLGPISHVDRWKMAQEGELQFHMAQQFRQNEHDKRLMYAKLLGIDASLAGKYVLDIGCGPESLMLDFGVTGVALDPLRFTDTDEARYANAHIQRLIQPAELPVRGKFDEIWCYNVLQHVKDPIRVLQNMKEMHCRIRLFEWLEVEIDQLHLHKLTYDMITQVLGEPWSYVRGEIRGGVMGVGGQYIAGVWG